MDEEREEADVRRDGGRYELRVRGHLDARWADWFDGLTLTHLSDGSTTIRGWVADQAALHGLLQRLRDLGLPLISVTELGRVEPETPRPEPRSSRTEPERQGDRHD